MFTDDSGTFNSLKNIQFKRIVMNIVAEQKHMLNMDNGNNSDGIVYTFFDELILL